MWVPHLLHCLLVSVWALEQLVEGHCVLLELGGVRDVRHLQPVEGHEGHTPAPGLVQQLDQVQAHSVVVNNNLDARSSRTAQQQHTGQPQRSTHADELADG